MFEALGAGLAAVLQPQNVAALFAGTLFGWIVGILPGLGSVTALTVGLPLTFWWNPVAGMYFFAGIMGSASQGGAMTSILLNMPGEAQNAATMFDGHPLAKKGKAAWALGIAAGASVYGAFFGILVLIAIMPLFLPILLAIGPAEKLWVVLFGLVTLALTLPGSFFKGLVAVGIGILFTFIGVGGPELAVPRFTFGSTFLLDGLNLVAVLIGLLVVSESIEHLGLASRRDASGSTRPDASPPLGSLAKQLREAMGGLVVPLTYPVSLLRSSVIGTIIGAVPGVGGTVAQFLSYNAARSASHHPEQFGTGTPEGVVAAEAAVNAKEGGALMPTLLFGIPGNAETALLLAAWQIYGVQSGPFFLERHADLAWALIFGLFLSNIASSLLTITTVGVTAPVASLNRRYLAPSILVLVAISLVAIRGSVLDLAVGAAAGVLGFVQRRYGYPVIGTVIGFVLGTSLEQNFYTALQSARGSYGIFLATPASIVLAALTLGLPLLFLVLRARRAPRRPMAATA